MNNEDFKRFYLSSSLKGMRFGIGLAIFLFIAFGFIDPGTLQLTIRFAFICPVLILALGLSFSRFFEQYSQLIISTAYLLVSAGLIFMIQTVDGEIKEVYSIGVVLCVIGTSSIRMRVPGMLSASCVIVILFVTLPRTNGHELYVHLPILISSIGMTLLSISSTDKILWSNYNALLQLREERQKLGETKEKLQLADSMKGKLISVITHDLKGPNNNILSMLDLLFSKSISMEEFRFLSVKVKNQVKSNQALLESLLKWSVLQRQNKNNYSMINIRELVNEGIELVQDNASQKGNRLVNNVDDTIIMSDPEVIRMTLRNLLTNAIKYTENGSITFYNEFSSDKEFLLSIRDTGIGMTQEFAGSLFNWNSRRTTPGTNEEKGTGIGLLMCAEYLQNIGASLKIFSSPNEGTCITIIIKTEVLKTSMLETA